MSSSATFGDAGNRAAIRCMVCGAMVEATATTLPSRAPLSTPRSPNITASTSWSKPTTMMTRSLAAATACGDSAVATPASAACSIASSLTSKPATVKPRRTRWRAIGRPILPSPIRPTRRMSFAVTASFSLPQGAAPHRR